MEFANIEFLFFIFLNFAMPLEDIARVFFFWGPGPPRNRRAPGHLGAPGPFEPLGAFWTLGPQDPQGPQAAGSPRALGPWAPQELQGPSLGLLGQGRTGARAAPKPTSPTLPRVALLLVGFLRPNPRRPPYPSKIKGSVHFPNHARGTIIE